MMLGSGDSAWNRGPSLEGARGERLFIQVKYRRKKKKKKKGREIKNIKAALNYTKTHYLSRLTFINRFLSILLFVTRYLRNAY